MTKLENYIEKLTNSNTIDEKLTYAKETLDHVKSIKNPLDQKDTLVSTIKKLPKTKEFLSLHQLVFDIASGIDNPNEKRQALFDIIKELPYTNDFFSLLERAFISAIDSTSGIKELKHRNSTLIRLANQLPKTPKFVPLYEKAMKEAVEVSSMIEHNLTRKYALLDISNDLPTTDQFIPLRLHALKLVIGLEKGDQYKKYSLDEIAVNLPKPSDNFFYKKYSLFGIVKKLPKTGEFLELYKETINLALKATELLKEPHSRKYVYLMIAKELTDNQEFLPLYSKVMILAYDASIQIVELFSKKHALLEVLHELPKTEEFFPLVSKIIEQILRSFTLKKKFEEINWIHIIDTILLIDVKKMSDSDKKQYVRTKYGHLLAKELNEFGSKLKDLRLIEILRPYTHVWIQPKELRVALKKVVNNLEKLKKDYHGQEIMKPLFLKQKFLPNEFQTTNRKQKTSVKECISIDLGTTNTVIMSKTADSPPEFVVIDSVSRQYGNIQIIPSILSYEANKIGMQAKSDKSIINFKKMLLDGHVDGKKYMERYVNIVHNLLRNKFKSSQIKASSKLTNNLFVTVPVGFHDYKKSLEEIIKKNNKGVHVEFIEEPLAAAIGYQVAETLDKIIIVIDFGGCTLDVMMLRLNLDAVHVISKPDRAKMLGGNDIDVWLANYLSEKLGDSKVTPKMLIDKAEEIKISLSEKKEVPFLWNAKEVCRINRDDLEEILDKNNFYQNIDRAISDLLHRAEKIAITKDRIEAILLTGGSSQIPSFKEKIGSLFPKLREENAIYDHSPLSAVAKGAALYGTRDLIDKHLSLAYALRYTTKNEDHPFNYDIIFEKGESFPFEKTFRMTPSNTLGDQKDIYLEFFEISESRIVRRWEKESEIELIKQAVKYLDNMVLKAFKIITLSHNKPINETIDITFCVDSLAHLKIQYDNNEIDTGIRLQ